MQGEFQSTKKYCDDLSTKYYLEDIANGEQRLRGTFGSPFAFFDLYYMEAFRNAIRLYLRCLKTTIAPYTCYAICVLFFCQRVGVMFHSAGPAQLYTCMQWPHTNEVLEYSENGVWQY